MSQPVALRFSKPAIINDLENRVAQLEKDHGFSWGDGWSKVEGKPMPTIIAFGHYSAFRELLEEWT